MRDGAQVGSGYDVHRPVFAIDVIEREPATEEIGGCTLPVRIVLMPEDGFPLAGGFVERLVVEKLDVRPEKTLDDVENAIIVEQLSIEQAALAHLHNLQHLLCLDLQF